MELFLVGEKIKVFQHEGLQSVYAGWTHSIALTKMGEVFSWGRNSYGQLGSERELSYKPEKIEALDNINQISVGSEHNLAVTKDSGLYSWGWNEHGSCGTGDKMDVLKPTRILENKKVKLAFACTGTSFAIVE
ncbi:hypothetical protein GWI33_005948 [Rhynchophorus ferrugineus]|uniref:Uncharacterized protein n=1 Tax=Rhynchophorus ferrugineus TaxID=354439 RepID=A0A834J033_RHYFE|nr:hypothetical protein GWI33_005948 [Rhynchophorus ferrugineus]